jgi:adenosylhomocysteine nucleosidase
VNPLLILTAVELEARALARQLELPRLASFPFVAFGRGSVRLAPVGLRAALCDSRWPGLLDGLGHPLVVSAGVCGALDPRLAHGDLVIPECVIGPGGDVLAIPRSHHRAAVARAGAAVCTGALVSTAEIVATPDAKALLHAATGAVAVDMESAVIVARAAAFDCPALVVRGVSDDAREFLPPELVGLITPAGGLRVARALALTVMRPAVLSRAFTLRRRTQGALKAVARVLAALTS